jgi:hypothetical protein
VTIFQNVAVSAREKVQDALFLLEPKLKIVTKVPRWDALYT